MEIKFEVLIIYETLYYRGIIFLFVGSFVRDVFRMFFAIFNADLQAQTVVLSTQFWMKEWMKKYSSHSKRKLLHAQWRTYPNFFSYCCASFLDL